MNSPEPVGNHIATWGEGPVWWCDHLYYVDIQGKKFIRLDPESGEENVWSVDQRIGFALPTDDGHWIWGGDNGLYLMDPESGEQRFLADPEPDLPNNRFNDAAVSPDGRLFAGTIAMDKTTAAATLYRLEADGTVTPVVPGVTNSNGLAWSPDGTRCYYIDTPTQKITRYAYHAEDGSFSDPVTLLDTGPLVDASPDGMCTDAEGKLWVAFCHGACVLRVDPESREVLDRVDVPCIETTSCCFGGHDLRTLYITTGIASGKSEPYAGRIFAFQPSGITGMPQTPVQQFPKQP